MKTMKMDLSNKLSILVVVFTALLIVFASAALTLGCMNPAATEQDFQSKTLTPFDGQTEITTPEKPQPAMEPMCGDYYEGVPCVGEVKYRVNEFDHNGTFIRVLAEAWTPVYFTAAPSSGVGQIGHARIKAEDVPGMDNDTWIAVSDLSWNVLGEDLHCPTKKDHNKLVNTNLEWITLIDFIECRGPQIGASIRPRERVSVVMSVR